MFVGVSKIFVLVRRIRDVWAWLKCMHAHMRTSAAIVKVWFPECPLFGGKNTWQKRFGTTDSVRCPEFRGGRFSEVANVLQVSGFQSVTRTLSALGSVSASRSVRSGRFYCIYMVPCTIHTPHISVKNSIINGRLGVGSYHNNGFSIVIINIQVTITSNEDIMWRCIYRIRIFTIGSQSREMDVELQLTHTPPPETSGGHSAISSLLYSEARN